MFCSEHFQSVHGNLKKVTTLYSELVDSMLYRQFDRFFDVFGSQGKSIR
jgi:hypothetical protein